MFRVLNALTAVVVVIASLLTFSGHAYAHEDRTIGPYQFEVGWLNEPAYVGQLNSLSLNVTDTRNKQPVTGLAKTLTADVSAGGLSPFPLTLSADPDAAGTYNGLVLPTATGSYTFHIRGKVGSLDVDEKFSSGPNTFGDVEDTAALQYPTKIPVADALGKKLDAIQSGIDQTRIIAIVALALAVVGLGSAAVARRRRT